MANPTVLPINPSFQQEGQGETPGYSALDLRRGLNQVSVPGEGARGAGDFLVHGPTGMNVAVGSGDDDAWVRGDGINDQGLYACHLNSAVQVTVPTSDPSNPRIDKVILEVADDAVDGGGDNLAQIRVVAGTPTAGATLNNENGVANTPGTALLLATVLVPAGAASVTAGNIRDGRRWSGRAVPPPAIPSGGDQFTMIPDPCLGPLKVAGVLSANGARAWALFHVSERWLNLTQMKFAYVQGATASTGTFEVGIWSARGRKITSGTGVMDGVATAVRNPTVSVAAFNLEPGPHYVGYTHDETTTAKIPKPIGYDLSSVLGVVTKGRGFAQTGAPAMPSYMLDQTDVLDAAGIVISAGGLAVPLIAVGN